MNPLPYCKSILFISMGGIGNMVMLTPAIQLISERWPHAKLHFLLGPYASRTVIELHPSCGTIIETRSEWNHLPGAVIRCRTLRPDIVFASTGTNPLNCGLIGLLSGSAIRLGEQFGAGILLYTHRIPFDPRMHEAQANLKLAQHITGLMHSPESFVWTSEDDRQNAQTFLAGLPSGCRYIGLHPGAGAAMPYKRWPADCFADIARRILGQPDFHILIFGGPDETEPCRQLANAIGPGATSCAGSLSVRQSYEAMKRCALFISNDSGPMHLAASAGCPVVALFGPTDPSRSGPGNGRHTIIRGSCGTAPCYHGKPLSCRDFSCMSSITVDQVWSAVKTQVSQ
jgi:ADP-heptose:LPS heptosyltransferase